MGGLHQDATNWNPEVQPRITCCGAKPRRTTTRRTDGTTNFANFTNEKQRTDFWGNGNGNGTSRESTTKGEAPFRHTPVRHTCGGAVVAAGPPQAAACCGGCRFLLLFPQRAPFLLYSRSFVKFVVPSVSVVIHNPHENRKTQSVQVILARALSGASTSIWWVPFPGGAGTEEKTTTDEAGF